MYCVTVMFGCAVHLKIEEIGRMLRTGDLGIPTNPSERYANSYRVGVCLSIYYEFECLPRNFSCVEINFVLIVLRITAVAWRRL